MARLPISSRIALLLAATTLAVSPLKAWHHQGHTDVGALADRLLARDHHAHALERVHAILGDVTLGQAGPWADCLRNVQGPATHFNYNSTDVLNDAAHTRTQCYMFSHDEARLLQMRQYAERNWANEEDCRHDALKNGCHLQFHFADVAIQQGRYAANVAGVEHYDIVHALNAAVGVLRSEPCNRAHPSTAEVPGFPPFHFTCADALMMLVHLIGDLHQPLHVGSVYLDAAGNRVDPDSSPAARALADPNNPHTTQTRGGNSLKWGRTGSSDLHSLWDETGPYRYSANYTDIELNRVLRTPVPDLWAETWATESIRAARDTAFTGLQFGNWAARRRADGAHTAWSGGWSVNWRPNQLASYGTTMATVQHDRIVLAGARLTQLLVSIWPDRP